MYTGRNIGIMLLAALVLCFMGFYNNFPLVFYDTGSYLYSGFTNEVPYDRPIIYGLILRHISMADSLWLVIIFQGMLLSVSLFYVFHYVMTFRGKEYLFMAYVFLITFFTGASVNVSQLIPDVFISIAILNLFLLITIEKLPLRDRIILSVIFWISTAVHNSHIMIGFMALFLITLIWLFKGFRLALPFLKWRSIVYLWSLLLVTYFSVSAIHVGFGSRFTWSKGSHVFMISRLNELGLLYGFLKERCPEENYKLCAYMDALPWDFLWDTENSPVYKTGGWEKNKTEYNHIIRSFFSTPKYVVKYASRSVENGVKLFFSFDAGDTPVQNQGTMTYDQIHDRFRPKVNEYFSSLQSRGQLTYYTVNHSQRILFGVSLLLGFMMLFSKIPPRYRFMMVFFLGALLINAWVCGTFSGCYSRYQSRVVWLLPLPVLLVLFNTDLVKRIWWSLLSYIKPDHES